MVYLIVLGEGVPRSSPLLSLEEQFQSIKHAIWASYPVGSKPRVLESRPGTLIRPSWRVSYLTHHDQQIMSRVFRQVVDWTIDYYGMNRMDVQDRLNDLELVFKQGGTQHRLVNLIPAWRFDWQFPQVFLDPLTDVVGVIPAGVHHVRVSGIDVCDDKSGASADQTVTLAPGQNAIRVRLPRVPYSHPVFKQYAIYIDGHQERVIDTPSRDGMLYPQTLITNLLGTGAAPIDPADTVRVRWKFLRVTGFAASSTEDDVKSGVFTGNISLQTTVEQEHERTQLPTVERVDILTTVPDGQFTITVGVL